MGAVDSYEIHGSPGPEEEQAILAALEAALTEERVRNPASLWTAAGRAAGLRTSLPEGPGWTAAGRLAPRSPAHQFRRGRGDSC